MTRRLTPPRGSLIASPVMALSAMLVPMVLMASVVSPVGAMETQIGHVPHACGHDASLGLTLDVVVQVHDWGLEVSGDDPMLFGNAALACPGHRCSTRPDYDLDGLQALLSDLRVRHDHEARVYVAAGGKVSWDAVVAVVEASSGPNSSWPVLTLNPDS